MSTRTAPSMTPRGGGGGPSSWQKPSGVGTSSARGNSRQAPLKNSRGYSVPSVNNNSNNNNKSLRPSSQKNPPSFAPPPARQERRDSPYYRNDGRHVKTNANNHNRERDRDQQYRRDPKDYRQNEFDGGQIRYDDRERDRDRNTNRGKGYDDRPPIYDMRTMGDDRNVNVNANRNERRYDSNYNESSRESSYNTNANRRPTMGGGCSNYDDGRTPTRQSGDNPGNGYRDSSIDHLNFEIMGNFGREHERERHNDCLDYQRQRPNGDTNDFRDHFHDNDSERYPSRYSTGRRDQNNNGGIEDGSFRRNEYNDRGPGQQQQQQQRPRQPEQRWPAPSTASRGDDYHNDNGYNDRAGFPSHRTGMGDTRSGDTSERNRRHPSEWDFVMRRHPEEGRGPSMDARVGDRRPDVFVDAPGRGENNGSDARWNRGERETASGQALVPGDERFHKGCPNREEPRNKEHGRAESADSVLPQAVTSTLSTKDNRSDTVVSSARRHAVSETRGRVPVGSSSSPDNGDNATNYRKRQREKNSEPKPAVAGKKDRKENKPAEKVATKHVQKSSANIETNPKQGSGESKKIKLSTGASPSPSPSSSLHSSKTNKISTNQGIELKLQDSKSDTKIGVAKIASSSSLPRTSPAPTKTNTKSFPVKSPSSLLTKKHQIQAKPKPKTINKLGIPMRWLKPKAKPKPVKKVVPKVSEVASKLTKIPLKQASTKKSAFRPSSPSNRLVTDSSEGSSIISYKSSKANVASSSSWSAHPKKQKGTSVPAAIVTKKTKKASKNKTMHKSASIADDPEEQEEEWDSEAESEESDGDASDSESDTDDDEVLNWASKMLGVPASPSSIHPTDSNDSLEPNNSQNHNVDETSKTKSPKLRIRLSAALKLKLTESIQPSNNSNGLSAEYGNKLETALKKLDRRKKKREKLKALSEKINERPEFDHEKAKMEIEEGRRKREEAKPLTAKEIRKILRNDTFSGGGNQNSWVRRSRRQPNMDLLNSKPVRILVDKLKHNDTDMRVLKMKKYINDPNAPCAVMDAMLNAMEENTNCEALYIQVRTI
jgi:hypothetical protein